MSRVRGILMVNGSERRTLFDSGSRNTYIVPEVAEGLAIRNLSSPQRVALGGRIYSIGQIALLEGTIEGFWVTTETRVVEELGYDEERKRIEILFGTLAMQEWGIRLVPDEDRLDLTHYPKEFLEF